MSSDPVLSVRSVSKSYRIGTSSTPRTGRLTNLPAGPGGRGWSGRDFQALHDVSFEVAEGEIVGIIGRNGAGKSTLLKLLTRITGLDSGEIDVRGRVGSLLEVGTGFHPELTGRENVYLNGAILGMRRSEISRRFDEIVAFSEVEEFLDTPVKRYSSGMYVRLAFAVAAHLDCEVIIVDEVLAVGDAGFQAKCLAKIESLARDEGRTVLFVSHSMTAVQQLCDRALLLDHGRILAAGPTADVISQYMRAFTSDEGPTGAGVWDLTKRENEYGEVIFTELCLTSEGQPVEVLDVGAPLRITVGMELSQSVRHAAMGVTLATQSDLPIASFASVAEPQFFGDSTGPVTVHVDVPQLPLTPGVYFVSIGLQAAPGGYMFDAARHAGSFRVVDRQLDDTEFFRTRGQGFVVLPSLWSRESRP